jgi:hypothetical protein
VSDKFAIENVVYLMGSVCAFGDHCVALIHISISFLIVDIMMVRSQSPDMPIGTDDISVYCDQYRRSMRTTDIFPQIVSIVTTMMTEPF